MNIQNINSAQSFGKKPVMICTVKKADTQEKAESTLYKLDPKSGSDLSEVKYSKKAKYMYGSMKKDKTRIHPYSEYYFLKDNKTGEVISYAQTSHHYRRDNVSFPGLTTLIEEMDGNDKYINSQEPMFAFLAQNALNRFDSSITDGLYREDTTMLKRARFSQTKNGDWVLPEKRYTNLIDTAKKRSQIEFLV